MLGFLCQSTRRRQKASRSRRVAYGHHVNSMQMHLLKRYNLHVQVTLGTNYFGPMLLTHLLMDRLRESAPSRIVWVVSSLEVVGDISWEDLK